MGFSYEEYELSAIKNNTTKNSWSNATGDVADLEQKIKNLEAELKRFEDRWTYYDAQYESCRGIKKDKDRNACLVSRRPDVITADAGRTRVRRELSEAKSDLAIEKKRVYDLQNPSAGTGSGTGTGIGTGSGTTTTPETTPKKSNTVLYASVGGAILILVVVGFVVFRGKTNN